MCAVFAFSFHLKAQYGHILVYVHKQLFVFSLETITTYCDLHFLQVYISCTIDNWLLFTSLCLCSMYQQDSKSLYST